MGIGISEEHVALAASVRRFLERNCPPSVLRAGIEEGGSRSLPPFWQEMADLGLLGLHLPEHSGGQGYGMLELGVVAEEMGRACAPGPFLPTVLVSCLVAMGCADGTQAELLAALAGGGTAAVAFPASSALRAVREGTGIRVEGCVRPLPEAAGARWFLLPARSEAGEDMWCLVPAADVAVTAVSGLDPTRPVVEVTVEGAVVPPERVLGLDRQRVNDLVTVVAAAECVGGARWCVETAAEYSKVREQFGRPIGQFQAIKH
ncbi:MAG TPA: acyl-CoA dehydrogenase family protein, partial [Acidimicrobiales bacterium]|nr:acyl-CoA dehydrogenase family protein [Acidimicrobiales bacterium]